MAFDEQLANRVRDILAEVPGVSERRMFGGDQQDPQPSAACS
jgi:hypothetical protein